MKSKPKNPIIEEILSILAGIGEMIPEPFETPYAYIRRTGHLSRKRYYDAAYRLKKRGLVEISNKKNERFIKLTAEGQLAFLLSKAKIKEPQTWDGKWRIVMFDIPESAHEKRDQIRYLLKKMGFKKLQASVFVSPHPLNYSAVDFLKRSKLIGYIRILRVEQIDDDSELKKIFKVKWFKNL